MKGISPLIAAVLLIAFAISVGAIFGVYIIPFMKHQTGKVGEEGKETVTCSLMNFKIDVGTINTTSGVRMVVENIGSGKVSGLKLIAYNSTGSYILLTNATTIDEGGVTNLENDTLIININKIKVKSITCAGKESTAVNQSGGWKLSFD